MQTMNPVAEESLLEDAALFFKVLGDHTRLRIMHSLIGTERCVHGVSDMLDLSHSAVSHHLSLLRRSKLVSHRREGKHIYYRLDDDHVETILETALHHLTEQRT
mgnify:CR=1 FL=1